MKTILFLCTGNYYRSRFAEEMFNHSAARASVDWTAQSRALAIERGHANVGPISPVVLQALRDREVRPRGADRFRSNALRWTWKAPITSSRSRRTEHRPLILERLPQWERRLEYWHIDDIDGAEPVVTLALIDSHVDALIDRLLIRIG